MTDERPGEQEGIKPPNDDTQGHATKFRPFTPDADESPSDEAEGHAAKVRPFTPDAERPAQPGEQKGVRAKGISDESDTEG